MAPVLNPVANTVILNNTPTNTVSKIVEAVVLNGIVQPDPNQLNPGVNTSANPS